MEEPRRALACLFILALLVVHPAYAKTTKKKRERRKAKRLDKQLKQKKISCASSVQVSQASDLDCEGPHLDIENCVLRCVSEHCYQKIYAHEPLEDGEVDLSREAAFKLCGREELKNLELQMTS
ncbi:hypothetical protein BSKO_00128 [Bryopsis sp. KO-2023]|nr:hypothetical protein BSKO_00128 [Bryopsis sp. KO-2023]